MKIAVYTIALNEEKFVERWHESVKDADYLLIADTGSTDKTKRIAKKLGIRVVDISIKPWRFDDARNVALALLPDDIDMCVSLDMDEVLSEGWRQELEKTTAPQILYKYTQNWRDIETQIHPNVQFVSLKIHARHGYRWKNIVHELPYPDRNDNHSFEFSELQIFHKPDNEKSREAYNKLIVDTYNENPDSDRYQLYYAKNFIGVDNDKAIKEFLKFITMPTKETILTDKAFSYIVLAHLDNKNAKKYLQKSVKLCPERRESLVSLAMYHYKNENWRRCEKLSKKALLIKEQVVDYNYGEYAWGKLPENMLYASRENKKLWKWSKNYEANKIKLNVDSLIAQNFKIFKDEDVL